MRKQFKLFQILLAFAVFFGMHTVSFSQPPPPPPPSGHGLAGNAPPGGGSGAPIGEGMLLLIGMAGLYGGKKLLDLRKPVNSVEE